MLSHDDERRLAAIERELMNDPAFARRLARRYRTPRSRWASVLATVVGVLCALATVLGMLAESAALIVSGAALTVAAASVSPPEQAPALTLRRSRWALRLPPHAPRTHQHQDGRTDPGDEHESAHKNSGPEPAVRRATQVIAEDSSTSAATSRHAATGSSRVRAQTMTAACSSPYRATRSAPGRSPPLPARLLDSARHGLGEVLLDDAPGCRRLGGGRGSGVDHPPVPCSTRHG